MRKRLRLGSSGPTVRRSDGSLPQVGDLVTALADGTPVWAQPSANVGLLSNTFWIDQGATSPGTGSISSPFQTFAQAIAGIPVILASATFFVTPYDYSAEPAINIQLKYFAFIACGGGANGFAPGGPPYVVTPTFICNDANNNGCSLFFRGCSTDVTAGRSLIESDLSSLVVRAGSPGALTATTRVVARGDGRQVLSATCDQVEARGMRIGAMVVNTGLINASTFVTCTVGGNQTTPNQTYIDCPFSSTVTITATNLTWDDESKTNAARSLSLLFISGNITDTSAPNPFYGDGSAGNFTLPPGVTVVDNMAEYNNLTIPAGSQIQVRNAGILKVRGILDISNADVGAIVGRANTTVAPLSGNSGFGGNAAGAVGGTAGVAQNVGIPTMLSGAVAGTAGTTGVANTNGTTPAAPGAMTYAVGGNGGASGAGGAGGGGKAGGVAGTAPTLSTPRLYPSWQRIGVNGGDGLTGTTLGGGQSGRGGASGGGDAANAGGGGGGGASGPHYGPFLFSNYVRTSATTPASVVASWGSRGGNGGNSPGGDAGAGGGGSGGGGGLAACLYDYRLNAAPIAGSFDARGGAGGNGGNGTGTGVGGNGGNGGDGGQAFAINRLTGNVNRTTGGVGSAGTAAVGNAGGVGGAGAVCAASFPT